MRYDCDDPAFAGDFVEFSDSWSRAQVRATWATIPTVAQGNGDEAEDALLAQLRPKILGLRLTCTDAPPITDATELTPARTMEMDTRLYAWFANVWIVHLNGLANLGNALGRQLFATSATSKSTATIKKQPVARHRSRKS